MSAPVTQWFDGTVKPIHIGWYEMGESIGKIYLQFDYWNGRRWLIGMQTDAGFWWAIAPCQNQCRPWRGLADKPVTGEAG